MLGISDGDTDVKRGRGSLPPLLCGTLLVEGDDGETNFWETGDSRPLEHMDADAGKRLDFPQGPQEDGISSWFSDSLSFPGGRVGKKLPRNHNNKENHE